MHPRLGSMLSHCNAQSARNSNATLHMRSAAFIVRKFGGVVVLYPAVVQILRGHSLKCVRCIVV